MSRQKANIRKRMLVFYSAFMVLIVVLLLRTAYLQVFRGAELREAAERQQTRDSMITPKRGTIYDRNRKVLAQSASAEMVVLEPAIIKKKGNGREIAEKLSQILGMDYETIYKKTQKNSYYEIVKKKVEKDVADKVRALEMDGIRLDEDTKRYYPGGEFASHIVGFTGADNQGLGGIEMVYDSYLKGTPGRIKTAKNANGTDMPFESEQYLEAIEGNDVVLTIDEVIQHYAESHLEAAVADNQLANGAAAIVMDVKTGEILAMTTKPDFNLNQPFTAPSIMPFAKYFCRKGYTHMMGTITTSREAYWMEMVGILAVSISAALPPDSAMAVLAARMTSRSTSCTGQRSRSRI